MKSNLFALLLYSGIFCVGCASFSQTSTVTQDFTELQKALTNANPGDTIVVKSGEYSFDHKLLRYNGDPDNPIIIKAELPGKAVVKGYLTIRGKGLVLQDFLFDSIYANNDQSSIINLDSSAYITIKNNRFEKCGNINTRGTIILMQGNATNNLIQNNTFFKCYWAGVKILRIINCANNIISRNEFREIERRSDGDQCLIQLNNNAKNRNHLAKLNTVISENYFVNCKIRRSEIISVKASSNLIFNNVIDSSRNGDLTLRRGNNNQVSENYLFNSGGIRVYGKNQLISDNTIINPQNNPIELGNGDSDSTTYLAASFINVVGNLIINPEKVSITTGSNKDNHDGHPVTPNQITVSENVFYQKDFIDFRTNMFSTVSNNSIYINNDSIASRGKSETDTLNNTTFINESKSPIDQMIQISYLEAKIIRENSGADF